MASIQSLRDKLTHRIVFPEPDHILITTMQTAKEAKGKETIKTDLGTLADATHDLILITTKLHYLLYTWQTPEGEHLKRVEAPWRYKPVLPDQQGQ